MDYRNIENLVIDFNMKLAELADDGNREPWDQVSAPSSIALFDSEIDANVLNVFKRAEQKMYECKKAMKALREN